MAAVPSGAAATAGERGVSLSACVLQRWRHSMGSHCRSHDCLPKYCLCGSSLRTSDTGSPNTHYLGQIRSPRTRELRKPGPAVARKTHRQEQPWQLNSCGSSSTSVLDAGDNTETAVSIRRLNYSGPAIPPKADICSAQADVRRTIVGFCPLVCERF